MTSEEIIRRLFPAAVADIEKTFRRTLRLRIGPFAFHFREGLQAPGWSRIWWRLWRYSAADEYEFLERHAALWGVRPVEGESCKALRERILDVSRAWPRTGSRTEQRYGGDLP